MAQDDELAIHRLIVSGWAALDRQDWDTYAAAWAEDGEFRILGKHRRGRAEIAAGPAGDLVQYDAIQHVIANELVEVDGDEASGQWYAIAIHVPDAAQHSEHADAGLRYTFRARRIAEGWRFTDVRLELVWTAGLPLGEH
jgi:uncharacterized protein (TIGR02246 family)